MATAVAVAPGDFRLPMPRDVADLDAGKWRVLTEAIFPNARGPESILLALDYCRARGLDILKRPVNIVPVWNSALGREVETIWPSISEVEITAARTGKWAGMDRPVWGPMMTRTFRGSRKTKEGWKTVEETVEFPEWASVTVYRVIDGQPRAFSEEVYWLEAYGHSFGGELPNAQWIKRPRGQLAKVAKAHSLRAAFPEEDGGSPTAEEMAGQEIEGRAEPPEPKWSGPLPAPVPSGAPAAPAAPTGQPAPANAPAATPAAPERVDPETGELGSATPHALELIYGTDGELNWRAWGTSFVAAVRAAASLAELDGWMQQNDGALASMEEAAPKLFGHVKNAIAKRNEELGANNLEAG